MNFFFSCKLELYEGASRRGPERNNTWGAAKGAGRPLKSARVGLNKLAGTYNCGPTLFRQFSSRKLSFFSKEYFQAEAYQCFYRHYMVVNTVQHQLYVVNFYQEKDSCHFE